MMVFQADVHGGYLGKVLHKGIMLVLFESSSSEAQDQTYYTLAKKKALNQNTFENIVRYQQISKNYQNSGMNG